MDETWALAALVALDGEPHHLAVSNGTVYIDGERVTQGETSIFDRTLSPEEIRRLYDASGL